MQLDEDNGLNEAIPDKLFTINHFPSGAKAIPTAESDLLKEISGYQSDILLSFRDYEITEKQMIQFQSECNFCLEKIQKLKVSNKRSLKQYVLKNSILYRKSQNSL